mmetsp:Transcript_31009/g.74659  ORF Transcript_31009/g.74659 Transcript_31009/m.74659 type:complete len:130 (+) Transcript_31009:3659-4048(+)
MQQEHSRQQRILYWSPGTSPHPAANLHSEELSTLHGKDMSQPHHSILVALPAGTRSHCYENELACVDAPFSYNPLATYIVLFASVRIMEAAIDPASNETIHSHLFLQQQSHLCGLAKQHNAIYVVHSGC